MTPRTLHRFAPIALLAMLAVGCPFSHAVEFDEVFQPGPIVHAQDIPLEDMTREQLLERLESNIDTIVDESHVLAAEVDSLTSRLASAESGNRPPVALVGVLLVLAFLGGMACGLVERGKLPSRAILLALVVACPAHAQPFPHDSGQEFRTATNEVTDSGDVVGDDPVPAPAEPTIDGPALAPVGKFVYYQCTEAKPAAEGGVISYAWSADAGIDFGENATDQPRIELTGTPGTHELVCEVATWDGVKPRGKTYRKAFTIGDPPPPKPLASLVTKEQAASLALWYRATIAVVPQIETPEAFATVHGSKLAALDLAGSAFEAAVTPKFAAAFEGGKVNGVKLVAALEAVVKELGAPAPVPPKPDPPSPPVPVAGLRVLIVEETLDRGRLPAAQLSVIGGAAIREYAAAHGGQVRVMDDDDDPHLLSAEWQKLRASVTTPSPSWAVYTTTGGVSAPLPANVDAALSELQRIAP